MSLFPEKPTAAIRTTYSDTPTGTAARLLHRRGREWCDKLEEG